MKRLLMVACPAALAVVLAGCQSMALKSEDAAERMKAVRSIKDQDDLLDVALEKEYRDDVRLAAVERMEKMHALWRVWCFAVDNPALADKAFSRITDEKYLMRIALLAAYEESADEEDSRKKKEMATAGAAMGAGFGGSMLGAKAKGPGAKMAADTGTRVATQSIASAMPEKLKSAPYSPSQTNNAVAAAQKIATGDILEAIAKQSTAEPVQTVALRQYMRFAPTNTLAEVVKHGGLSEARISSSSYSDKDMRQNFISAAREIKDAALLEDLVEHGSLRPIAKKIVLARLFQMKEYGRVGRLMWECGATERDLRLVVPCVKDAKTLVAIFGEKNVAGILPEKELVTIGVPGGSHSDLPLAKARDVLGLVSSNDVFVELALSAKLFSIRQAAIERISGDACLAKVFLDPLASCPYDTSLKGYDSLGAAIGAAFGARGNNMFDWISDAESKSADKLRKLVASRMKDVDELKKTRRAAKSAAAKSAITVRLGELGADDAEEIIAAKGYDADVMTMMEGVTKEASLRQIVEKAELKGLRLTAAAKISEDMLAQVAKKETPPDAGECPKGKLDVCGIHLGTGIEDVFARVAAIAPQTKPVLYLDNGGKVLCLKGANGGDIAWANNSGSVPIHWLTLPPEAVKGLFAFENGTIEDLEKAIGKKMNASFGSDKIMKGEVTQSIGNLDTANGETLRFFRSDVSAGESLERKMRKAVNEASSEDNLGAGLGAALANAAEDANQARENAANMSSPCFAEKGSLQLLQTEKAEKGKLGASGSWNAASAVGAALDKVKDLTDKAEKAAKEAEKALPDIKKAVKDAEKAQDLLKKASDASLDDLLNL